MAQAAAALETIATVSPIRSIQQEQLDAEHTAPTRMAQDDVEEHLEGASDGEAACRERGRHLMPAIRSMGDLIFTERTKEGLWVRHVKCTSCEMVGRREFYEAYKVRGGYNFRFVTSVPDYSDAVDKKTGRRYLAKPGQGRMAPSQVKEALISQALRGVTLTALKKSLPKEA